MITSSPFIGTGLHAIGGMSAASCYLPFEKVKKWPWGIFWIVQAFFAWLILPFVIGYFTVPDLFIVLSESPSSAFWPAFVLGAFYGFGGLSFGYAIRNIGYSLTYTIAIGISAVLGTIVPLIIRGEIIEQFTKIGGGVVLTGMIILPIWLIWLQTRPLENGGRFASLARFHWKVGTKKNGGPIWRRSFILINLTLKKLHLKHA